MIPDVKKSEILVALQLFDVELRNTAEWIGWEDKGTQKYAIEHEGRRYSPKKIISMATGIGRNEFNGGHESNSYLEKKGFAIEHEGRRYSPKKIISMATGIGRNEFNGGHESNSYLEKKGFAIIRLREKSFVIKETIESILDKYIESKTTEQFSHASNAVKSFKMLDAELSSSTPVSSRPSLTTSFSCGQGNFARVPWLAFLDHREEL